MPGAGRARRPGDVGGEPVAVGGLQLHLLRVERTARDRARSAGRESWSKHMAGLLAGREAGGGSDCARSVAARSSPCGGAPARLARAGRRGQPRTTGAQRAATLR